MVSCENRVLVEDRSCGASPKSHETLNERSLQVGHVLPLNEKLLSEYFPADKNYLVLQGRKPLALFSYYPRVHKVALARFRILTDSNLELREALKTIEMTALAEERHIVKTTVFGYERERVEALRKFG